jgi:hypothetical protein
MAPILVLAAAFAAAGVEPATASAVDPAAPPAAESAAPMPTPEATPDPVPKLVLPKGTMVRLMVTKEVNSRDNHPGDKFALRVDEAVLVQGITVIPIGAKGWGELLGAEKTSGIGKSGKINARLLYVEANGQHVDLDGERQSSGSGGTGNVVAGVIAFGPFGLFMKGSNASLKAGEILNGYTISDAAFDLPPTKAP